jgi:hypothetical protein
LESEPYRAKGADREMIEREIERLFAQDQPMMG